MKVSIVSSLLLFISLFSLSQTTAFARKQSYIVYLGAHPRHSNAPAVGHDHALNYHYEVLASCLGSVKKAKQSIFYSYHNFINGFAAVLEDDEVTKVARHPKVISVFLNQARKLKTTRSWDYLGLEKDYGVPSNSAWKKARFGEDTIIANIDSGIEPESKSFSDEGMGPIPSKWRGVCQTNKKDGVKCNRKLIGAKFFNRAFLQSTREAFQKENKTFVVTPELMSPRDHSGHGTHTIGIAGGSYVDNVNYLGLANGTAKGTAPKARVAVYKACWGIGQEDMGCDAADVIAACEAAIYDGVDVLSISLGYSPVDFIKDPIAIGSFHAVMNGLVVVAAASNEGPAPGTIPNAAPWMLTVAASTMDREFINYVTLGNNKVFKGASLAVKSLPSNKSYPLMKASDASANNATPADAALCKPGTLAPQKANGTILVCLDGMISKEEKSDQAAYAGAVGMILPNNITNGVYTTADDLAIPSSNINFSDGESLFAYMNSTNTPVAHISNVQTEINPKSDTTIADFSSRGPNVIDPAILKPDVTAPGVNIIGPYPKRVPVTPRGGGELHVPYYFESGTSMSCPMVAGIAALVKTVHPDWSPSAIRSAIMTTARTRGGSSKQILDSNYLPATPFAYGAGHVRPNNAIDPGLVYDLTVQDYTNYLCYRGYNQSAINLMRHSNDSYSCPKDFNILDFNYPSIAVPKLGGKATITRKLKNVGSPGTYNVRIKRPAGVSVFVEPSSLKFTTVGEEKTFKVTLIRKSKVKTNNYVFGQIRWSDGYHYVRSPIAVQL